MEPTLFSFIWKYSKRQQLGLLLITLLTFPLLYATLELPKRIINDAIGSTTNAVMVFGYELSQIQFLLILCFGFLISVLLNGVLKMKLNTLKGVLAERLLRRFRFQLLSRMLKFPKPYFRTTSQGELVSMVTSEAEPMGGLMGDALSQPVFQAGQMLTILAFLFAQSIWFGLASVALIPFQAWLIPKLQHQINLLNKSRIQEVRKLASEIGESAAGISDLRINGGLRYRRALYSSRLGNLFNIRFNIYQKKFFMKFINNFINQLTPFFFYSVGGYLAIKGDITVGALVAALAAYKDLSSPWKALLQYYNQVQDMSLRWETVTDRFAPNTLVDDALFEGQPDQIPHLKGDIILENVTVLDDDNFAVLEDINLTISRGACVGIKTSNVVEGAVLADLLTREVLPSRGSVTVAGQNLNSLHQSVISSRIGYAHSNPYLFEGTLGGNMLMPLKLSPHIGSDAMIAARDWQEEAEKSGNSIDILDADWMDPTLAEYDTTEEVLDWWFQLVEAMGVDDFMVRRALRSVFNPKIQNSLTQKIVELRPEIARRITEAGLDDIVFHFHPDQYNPVSPMGANLLYAVPAAPLTLQELASETGLLAIFEHEGLVEMMGDLSASVIDLLTATFGQDGTDHPLFKMLNLDEELYFRLGKISAKRRELGDDGLAPGELALLITIPFTFSAEQIGPSFDDALKERILKIRRTSATDLVKDLNGLFRPLDPNEYIPIMTLMGNALFGRVSAMAGARELDVENIIIDVLNEHGLRRKTAQSMHDLTTGLGGVNLPPVFRERAAFSRATIKRPDILIMENALASHDAESRRLTRERLCSLLPETTSIFIQDHFENPDSYDYYFEIKDGRIDGGARLEPEHQDNAARQDLETKLQEIAKTELFGKLSRKNQRLLAFSSQWFTAKPGQLVFSEGQTPDAAYLCVKGKAGLYWPEIELRTEPISEIEPGRLIGDLSVILNDKRNLNLIAIEETVFLRIGAKEFLAVVESDAAVAKSLLEAVARHLTKAADFIRDSSIEFSADS